MLVACSSMPPVVDGKRKGVWPFQMNVNQMFPEKKLRTLARAAGNGEAKKIGDIVASGIDVNGRGVNDLTPLYWALQEGNLTGFVALLEAGADPEIYVGCDGRRMIVQNAKVVGCSSTTVMHGSISLNEPEFLEVALQYGGNPNLVDVQGNTLLGRVFQNDLEFMQLLLSYRADVNLLTGGVGQREPPLMSALTAQKYDVFQLLLDHGADVHAIDEHGASIKDLMWLYIMLRKKSGRNLASLLKIKDDLANQGMKFLSEEEYRLKFDQ